MNATKPAHTSYLPDLCRPSGVLVTVLVCELIAIILTLSPALPSDNRWHTLGVLSLFAQWLGLSSASLTCALRRPLARFSDAQAGLLLYLGLLVNTLLISELAYQGAALALYPPENLPDHLSFVLRSLIISAILHAFALRYLYVQAQWRRNVEAEAEARFQALQARIRPHFLFNTMNTIACLVRDHPAQAEQAILDLSELLHASLNQSQTCYPLDDELALCQHYLGLEQLRLADRLRIHWRLDVGLGQWPVPPLTLQPILENAVYHGIEQLPEGGEIRISLRDDAGSLHITVSNPLGDSKHSGHQLAQQNVRQRLRLAYGEGASFDTMVDNGHYTVTMRLPNTLCAS